MIQTDLLSLKLSCNSESIFRKFLIFAISLLSCEDDWACTSYVGGFQRRSICFLCLKKLWPFPLSLLMAKSIVTSWTFSLDEELHLLDHLNCYLGSSILWVGCPTCSASASSTELHRVTYHYPAYLFTTWWCSERQGASSIAWLLVLSMLLDPSKGLPDN